MTDQTLQALAAITALTGVIAYAILGGADFGGGVWDLFSFGSRKREQRDAIAHAMGPVWEANHVWLIFVLVILFTCFPVGYSKLMVMLFVPMHLALLGIILRGAAFIFRSHVSHEPNMPVRRGAIHVSLWTVIFGTASTITPVVLGMAFGATTSGESGGSTPAWLRPYPIACGVLALSTCAYLAAVYLTVESEGKLRDDFRTRAILAGTSTAILAFVVLILARLHARWFFDQLTSLRTAPIIGIGLILFAGSAYAVFRRLYRLSRICAAGEIILLLVGWGVAQWPYLVYPIAPLASSAAPIQTLRFTLIAAVCGMMLLAPSLWLLFRVFKAR